MNREWGTQWSNFPFLYLLTLGLLAATMLFLRNLERSNLGRAWVALREDELAASCMGLNPAKLKLVAMAIGAGLAGLAGSLNAVYLKTTGNPQSYDFTLSMIMVCCVILGGLGNRSGVILGVFILIGFDRIVTSILDNIIQEAVGTGGATYLKISAWKLFIFGSVLIVMMRFRPAGLLPEARHKRELQSGEGGPEAPPIGGRDAG
jgi:branched-chain amino acid transport system permease protein